MKLKNLKLNVSNICPNRGGEFELVETQVNRVRLDNGTFGKDVDTYSLICATFKGDTIKIKVPKNLMDEVTKVTDYVNLDKVVYVTFQGLQIKAYAMSSDNPNMPVISGVMGTATGFTYRTEDDDNYEIEV